MNHVMMIDPKDGDDEKTKKKLRNLGASSGIELANTANELSAKFGTCNSNTRTFKMMANMPSLNASRRVLIIN
jgi:hypothetical protein